VDSEQWDREAASFDEEPDHGLADPAVRARWRELLLGVLPPAPARVADLRFLAGDAARPPLPPAAYDVVLSRHVLWAMPDPAAAFAAWVELLAPGGVVVLVEGRWSTGAGLRADEARSIVQGVRAEALVRQLPDVGLWGRPIEDERYLLLSRR